MKRTHVAALAAFVLVAVCGIGSLSAESKQAPPDVGQVFAALRQMHGFEAQFTEEKHLALLKAPLRSSGRLYYASPGRLVRQVESPERMTIFVSKGVVTIRDSEGTRRMDLSSRPGVLAFVEAFAHFLDGNEKELRKHFSLSYKASGEEFSLLLRPLGEPLSRVVASISLSGSADVVQELVVTETNGDKSVTRLTQVNNRRKFSPEEEKKIFGR